MRSSEAESQAQSKTFDRGGVVLMAVLAGKGPDGSNNGLGLGIGIVTGSERPEYLAVRIVRCD